MTALLRKAESFKSICLCMEVHGRLSPVVRKVFYRGALKYEVKKDSKPDQSQKGFKIPNKQMVPERCFLVSLSFVKTAF